MKCEVVAHTIFLRSFRRAFIAFWSSRHRLCIAAASSCCVLNFCLSVVNAWSNPASRVLSLKSFSGTCLYRLRLALRSSTMRFFISALCFDFLAVLDQSKRTGSEGAMVVPSTWAGGSGSLGSVCMQ